MWLPRLPMVRFSVSQAFSIPLRCVGEVCTQVSEPAIYTYLHLCATIWPSLFPILFGEFLLPVFFLKRGGSGRVSAAAYINLKTSWSFEDPFADCTI